VRRVRVTPVAGAVGSPYRLAAATSGPNGVAGLIDLLRVVPTASQTALVEGAVKALPQSPELARLQQARPAR
jgi:hypothetical protein